MHSASKNLPCTMNRSRTQFYFRPFQLSSVVLGVCAATAWRWSQAASPADLVRHLWRQL
ncbi:hypothetical protein PAHAL_9G386900 [Panicum hallii]|uniref:Uncharacterized protein n=1 Tax=Panicum hallii TaxID=206008 RepID=A0A2T8I3Y1_9POAL|nr:hypothetical protein PAHAL_9G386900 [Panicum hallii]